MATDAEKTASQSLLLWTGWVVGPVAWALHILLSYPLMEWVCRTDNYWVLHTLTLATLLMAAVGALVAWRQWTAVGRQWPDANGDPMTRTRFLAASGLIISGLSMLLIVIEGIPNFMLSACL